MIIAITSMAPHRHSEIDRRFGRAHGFWIIDTEHGDEHFVSNKQNLNAVQGAGIQAAQLVATAGAEAVITGHCGPKAFRTLQAAHISVHTVGPVTVSEALELFHQGRLKAAEFSDVDGHWQT